MNNWISVKDRLPEDNQRVITYKNGVIEFQWYEKRRNGWINEKNWFWSMATVTHWIPLPKAPREEKENSITEAFKDGYHQGVQDMAGSIINRLLDLRTQAKGAQHAQLTEIISMVQGMEGAFR